MGHAAIETVVPNERESVIDDLSDAFADDALMRWLLRDDARHDQGRRRLFSVAIGSLAAAPVIERPQGGGAAAVWLRSRDLTPTPFLTELAALPSMVLATGWRRFNRLAAFRTLIDAKHPTTPEHAYLMFLGVRRDGQGRGLGSRLLAHATARLDAEAIPAYLETQTERNLALYRRHGFEVTWEARPRADAPLIWGMWREPRAD